RFTTLHRHHRGLDHSRHHRRLRRHRGLPFPASRPCPASGPRRRCDYPRPRPGPAHRWPRPCHLCHRLCRAATRCRGEPAGRQPINRASAHEPGKEQQMRKYLVLAALMAGTLWGTGAGAQQTDVIIGSSSVGGSYYLYAGGLSTYLNDNSETLRATAQTTRGSVENVRLLDAGRLQFGFANGGVVYEQKAGSGQFEGASSDKIRGIATIDIAPLHFVTFAGGNIKTLDDLPGKRVSVGAPGSGSANSTMNLFEAA